MLGVGNVGKELIKQTKNLPRYRYISFSDTSCALLCNVLKVGQRASSFRPYFSVSYRSQWGYEPGGREFELERRVAPQFDPRPTKSAGRRRTRGSEAAGQSLRGRSRPSMASAVLVTPSA